MRGYLVSIMSLRYYNIDGDLETLQVLARYYGFIIPADEDVDEVRINYSRVRSLMAHFYCSQSNR
jgi:hypothetical protein